MREPTPQLLEDLHDYLVTWKAPPSLCVHPDGPDVVFGRMADVLEKKGRGLGATGDMCLAAVRNELFGADKNRVCVYALCAGFFRWLSGHVGTGHNDARRHSRAEFPDMFAFYVWISRGVDRCTGCDDILVLRKLAALVQIVIDN